MLDNKISNAEIIKLEINTSVSHLNINKGIAVTRKMGTVRFLKIA